MTDYNAKSKKDVDTIPSEENKPITYAVTADRLNVRSAPDANAEVKFIAAKGERFTDLGGGNADFVEVRIKDGSNRKGFAMRKFLKKV